MNNEFGRLLLCTDMDRTLIPNGSQPESPGARVLFHKLAMQTGIVLVYVTGRHKELVEAAIDEFDLPQPDFVISDVGSTIYQVRNNHWEKLHDWDHYIGDCWGLYSCAELADKLGDISAIQLQEAEKQNTYKLSYYVPLDIDHQLISEKILARFKEINVDVNLIWSIDDIEQIGLLDVLPQRAGKQQAISFLLKQQGLHSVDAVFAGDSGNDISVMVSEIPSVLVANATNDVRLAALSQASEKGLSDSLYIATGGFLHMNGNYSAGILEGVAYFKPEIGQWMQVQ